MNQLLDESDLTAEDRVKIESENAKRLLKL